MSDYTNEDVKSDIKKVYDEQLEPAGLRLIAWMAERQLHDLEFRETSIKNLFESAKRTREDKYLSHEMKQMGLIRVENELIALHATKDVMDRFDKICEEGDHNDGA